MMMIKFGSKKRTAGGIPSSLPTRKESSTEITLQTWPLFHFLLNPPWSFHFRTYKSYLGTTSSPRECVFVIHQHIIHESQYQWVLLFELPWKGPRISLTKHFLVVVLRVFSFFDSHHQECHTNRPSRNVFPNFRDELKKRVLFAFSVNVMQQTVEVGQVFSSIDHCVTQWSLSSVKLRFIQHNNRWWWRRN